MYQTPRYRRQIQVLCCLIGPCKFLKRAKRRCRTSKTVASPHVLQTNGVKGLLFVQASHSWFPFRLIAFGEILPPSSNLLTFLGDLQLIKTSNDAKEILIGVSPLSFSTFLDEEATHFIRRCANLTIMIACEKTYMMGIEYSPCIAEPILLVFLPLLPNYLYLFLIIHSRSGGV